MKETKHWDAKPIREPYMLKTLQQTMETLTNIEFSSRLLLGALYKQMSVNPVDYVYDSLQTKFRLMHQGDPEYDLVYQYIKHTCDHDMATNPKFNLFKVQRKGEGERYERY